MKKTLLYDNVLLKDSSPPQHPPPPLPTLEKTTFCQEGTQSVKRTVHKDKKFLHHRHLRHNNQSLQFNS